MTKIKIAFFVMLFLLCLMGAANAVDDDWRPVFEKDDIAVYARVHPDTDVREYKAEAILDEDISSVSAVLDNIPAAVEWFPFCRFAGLIDETDDGRKIIVNVADLPWPFQDRYAVFSSRKSGSAVSKQIVINFQIDEDSLARKVDPLVDTDGMVRVSFMKGQWTLTMLDRNKTEVVYTVCADAGGSIPGWLITTFFDSTPYKTLENLKQYVKKCNAQRSDMPGPEQSTVFPEGHPSSESSPFSGR